MSKKKVDVHAIDRAHAKLSASGSEKWMTCTPSAKLEEQFPDEGSEFASVGTFAHALGERRVCLYLKRKPQYASEQDIPEYDKYYSQELSDYVDDYVNMAIEKIEAARARCKDPVIYLEQRLDFSVWVPEGFGTGDLVIITDELIEVVDLKYGKGITVNAMDNSQLRLYGLGAYNVLSHLYDIKRVRMTVCQPRLNNFGWEDMGVDELLEWAEKEVVPKAQLAWDGKGEFVPGSHCSDCFCKARYQCAARANEGLAVAKSSFALVEPELLTLEQITSVLDKADVAIKWLKDIQDFAQKEAERGKTIPGYKLVEGRSNRRYKDADAVAIALQQAGIDQAVIYERSLLGISAMEKAIGKKKFDQLLGGLVDKPQGKPTLVPESDKRPVFKSDSGFSVITDDRS